MILKFNIGCFGFSSQGLRGLGAVALASGIIGSGGFSSGEVKAGAADFTSNSELTAVAGLIPDLGPLKQASTEAEAPPIPSLPDYVPYALDPDERGIVGLVPSPAANLGVGVLRPSNISSLKGTNWARSPLLNARWLRGVALPIYAEPAGEPWGWLINGWLIATDYTPISIGRDATFSMVKADRGLYSFPVLEIRPDGWFSFQYTPAGQAWAHLSQLALGSTALTIEPWETHVSEASQVRFRRHGISQPLRSSANRAASLKSLVGSNSIITPLAVEGDWMRVQVTQPAQGCTPLAGAFTEEGWMRWRDEDQTLLVWFVTDGC